MSDTIIGAIVGSAITAVLAVVLPKLIESPRKKELWDKQLNNVYLPIESAIKNKMGKSELAGLIQDILKDNERLLIGTNFEYMYLLEFDVFKDSIVSNTNWLLKKLKKPYDEKKINYGLLNHADKIKRRYNSILVFFPLFSLAFLFINKFINSLFAVYSTFLSVAFLVVGFYISNFIHKKLIKWGKT